MAKKKNKRQKTVPREGPVLLNPVAKYAHQSNRTAVFRDRTKYHRTIKRRGQEPWPIAVLMQLLVRAFVIQLSTAKEGRRPTGRLSESRRICCGLPPGDTNQRLRIQAA